MYHVELRLMIFFVLHVEGKKRITTTNRHVYANPWMPEICPFLVDGLYMLLVGVADETKIFAQSDASKALDALWKRWVKSRRSWLEARGFDIDEILQSINHGIRKGVTKMLCNAIEGPPIMATLLRVRTPV